MSDDTRREAVEAAAKALGQFQVTVDASGENATVWISPADDIATRAYDAIEPLVRRAVAEEIAGRIETECIDPEWPNDAESTNGAHAAAIARQAGGGT